MGKFTQLFNQADEIGVLCVRHAVARASSIRIIGDAEKMMVRATARYNLAQLRLLTVAGGVIDVESVQYRRGWICHECGAGRSCATLSNIPELAACAVGFGWHCAVRRLRRVGVRLFLRG